MPALIKTEVCRLLPHEGSMCLLDHVEQWDGSTIRCRAISHRDRENPLRHDGQLGIVSGLEYAAQAMGVHVGLLTRDRSSESEGKGLIGYVGGVRDVTLGVERLDDLSGDLVIDATRLIEGADSFMYQFTIAAGGITALTGRASIFIKGMTSS